MKEEKYFVGRKNCNGYTVYKMIDNTYSVHPMQTFNNIKAAKTYAKLMNMLDYYRENLPGIESVL